MGGSRSVSLVEIRWSGCRSDARIHRPNAHRCAVGSHSFSVEKERRASDRFCPRPLFLGFPSIESYTPEVVLKNLMMVMTMATTTTNSSEIQCRHREGPAELVNATVQPHNGEASDKKKTFLVF